MPNRLAAWLEGQPAGRRGLYTFFLAVTLLTLPCYLTAGVVLLTAGSGDGRSSQPASESGVAPTAADQATADASSPESTAAEIIAGTPTRVQRGAPVARATPTSAPAATQTPAIEATSAPATETAVALASPTTAATSTTAPSETPVPTSVPDLVTAPPASTSPSGAATLPPVVPIVPPAP